MGRVIVAGLTVSAFAALFLAIFYQVYLHPLLVVGGTWRTLEVIGNKKCNRDSTLQACESNVVFS